VAIVNQNQVEAESKKLLLSVVVAAVPLASAALMNLLISISGVLY
jgi:hypothetical protein